MQQLASLHGFHNCDSEARPFGARWGGEVGREGRGAFPSKFWKTKLSFQKQPDWPVSWAPKALPVA